jgi:secondary thiamine-phosphate synthase enzyme
MQEIHLQTNSRIEMIDITASVQAVVDSKKVSNGICIIFAPHTTAAITINENADPDVPHDIMTALDRLIPQNANYRHTEGNSPAHVKSSLIGASELVLIQNSRLILGTWQSIFFCEFDGPRSRRVLVSIIASK